jgi:hypothetical protein
MTYTNIMAGFSAAVMLILALCSTAAAQTTMPAPVCKTAVAHVEARVHGYRKTSVVDTQNTVYSPQAGWVIISYNCYSTGAFGTHTLTWGSNPGNFSSNMFSQLQTAYNDSQSYISNSNFTAAYTTSLNATLTSSYNQMVTYASQIYSSHPQVWMKATASGNGRFVGTGSMSGGSIDVCEMFVLPWMLSESGIRSHLFDPIKQACDRLKLQVAKPVEAGARMDALLLPAEADLLTGEVGRALMSLSPFYTNRDEIQAFVQKHSGIERLKSMPRQLPGILTTLSIIDATKPDLAPGEAAPSKEELAKELPAGREAEVRIAQEAPPKRQ